ncbi:hypothetical protein SDRG_12053 [Saprolegnia diclina VS20]|uniref:Major facilitator superfamily (MFS) profile domain-containing protein n=1 Tax=Saprolegnia diclina (strain VS20) TaxID=1156394 RepID=T0Q6G7_SAPDV|nr:hypothetical protein SDRG_12053 [Saprolegnia diclina VS20]EQC30201.1 hypothetical protein SDRG_12053 [Saprolegnia diclina VS20]|eukprot:XP_008616333.1 hypothetical protein SDRG_12053 [Saprolegnia diclina VS20]
MVVVTGPFSTRPRRPPTERFVEMLCALKRHHRWLPRLDRPATVAPIALAIMSFQVVRASLGSLPTDGTTVVVSFLTQHDLDWIVSFGTWIVAGTAPFAGHVTDRIGASKAVVGACLVAGGACLLLSILLTSDSVSKAVLMYSYGLFSALHSVATCAIAKVGATWYDKHERGRLAGMVGATFLCTDYVLATAPLQRLVASPNSASCFLSAVSLVFVFLATMAQLCSCDAPLRAIDEPLQGASSPALGVNGLGEVLRLDSMRGVAPAVVCLFYASDALRAQLPPTTMGLDNAWKLGSVVGAMALGSLSDVVFQSQRAPTIVLLFLVQAVGIYLVFALGPHVTYVAWLVTGASALLRGNIVLVWLTWPMDLPPEMTASASGVLTTLSSIGAGVASIAASCFVNTHVCLVSLLAACLAGSGSMLRVYLVALYPPHEAVETLPLYRRRRDDVRSVHVSRRASF